MLFKFAPAYIFPYEVSAKACGCEVTKSPPPDLPKPNQWKIKAQATSTPITTTAAAAIIIVFMRGFFFEEGCAAVDVTGSGTGIAC